MELETLETKRLYLKKITPEVFTDLFEKYSEDQVISLLGLNNHDDFIREKEKARGGYKTYDRTIVAFVMILKKTGETIGRCGFHNWYLQHYKAEIGYVLFKEENKRKGYMTEALEAILNYGFNSMELNRIEACIGPDNVASLQTVKKFGFSQEGYLRQHFVRDGEVQDTTIHSLLKEEYRN